MRYPLPNTSRDSNLDRQHISVGGSIATDTGLLSGYKILPTGAYLRGNNCHRRTLVVGNGFSHDASGS